MIENPESIGIVVDVSNMHDTVPVLTHYDQIIRSMLRKEICGCIILNSSEV